MTWKKMTVDDCHEWKLGAVDDCDRNTWRSGVRSALYAASQPHGWWPNGVDDTPALQVNQKHDDGDDDAPVPMIINCLSDL